MVLGGNNNHAQETTNGLPEASSDAAKEELAPQENSSLTQEPTGATEVTDDFSSLVGKITKKSLETLGYDIIDVVFMSLDTCLFGNPHDIRALRKDVTDLIQKLHGEDAKAIPWDTRKEWVLTVTLKGPLEMKLLRCEMMRGTCSTSFRCSNPRKFRRNVPWNFHRKFPRNGALGIFRGMSPSVYSEEHVPRAVVQKKEEPTGCDDPNRPNVPSSLEPTE
ncbi:hypothetical protein F2Q69_00052426 [Brassica cretica]|uniref:Uncharacterized protein n=1 Tax=Brassica cretica TaxID=69181 RepID=A0A8S9N7X2_BRACR|nr:hypothetical protein F2Q69_00052426 [Brassica cretica]